MSTEGRPAPKDRAEGARREADSRLAALSGERRRLLERLLRQRRAGGVEAAEAPAAPGPVRVGGDEHPLSPGQLGLWLACEAAPESAAYHMPALLRLVGPLSVSALAAALDAVVARHEALRTRVEVADGAPVQRVAPPAPGRLPLCDLSALPEARRKDHLRSLGGRLAAQPLDLAAGPPLRAALLRLGRRRHYLSLTVHHVVADRWSMAVVTEELATLYRPRGEGAVGSGDLPAAPSLHLADHAAWQRRRLSSGELKAQTEHWQRALDGFPDDLELPTDRPRPDRATGRGGRLTTGLPSATAVGELAAVSKATPFMVLLTAYAAFLHRLTGRSRMLVGTPVAGRQRRELRRVVGLLVDVLPLPVEIDPAVGFAAAVETVRSFCLDAFGHQEVPFHHLVETLKPARDGGRHPFFQVLFSYQDLDVPLDGFAGLDASLQPVDTASSQFDLTLVVRREKGRLVADWEYSRDLFDQATVAELAASFSAFSGAALAAPHRALARLPLLTPDQRRRLEEDWNPQRGAAAPLGLAATVHSLVEEAAARTPQAVALEMEGGGEAWTYRRLDTEAEGLARRLVAAGAGVGRRVGLAVERSPWMVAGLLAVLKTGAAVVPLDPDHPADRLAWMAADAALTVVLCDTAGDAALPTGAAPRVHLQAGNRDEAAGAAVALPGEIPPDTPAYVIYTSGSTGRPKGVAVPHGVAAEHFASWARRFGLGPGDRVYQFAPLSFDAGLEQTVPSLAVGARLVLRGPQPPAPEDLARRAESDGLTVLYLPAAYWQAMTRAWERGEAGPGRLRLVNPGGDVMAPEAVRRWAATPLAGVELLNGYGPTEAVVTTAACSVPVERWAAGAGGGRVPIGEPFPGRRVHLLDRRGEPLPPGVSGELHVGGPYLATGYLDRPGRTATAFVPDPFSPIPGSRLYRTGDLVRHRPDGQLDFLGRVDHQVKVRGFRIELGEVEAALEALPAIERAVAAAPADDAGGRRLVAYLVAAGDATAGELEPGALRGALAGSLPEHMVPTVWVVLDRLPLTPNGKVDRRALPSPEEAGAAEAAAERVAPEGPRQEFLARLWAEILEVPEVGARDDFFALGGDSILSLRIISRAHAEGLALTPSQFFRYPTVAELAAAAESVGAAPREEGPSTGPVPPTPIQRWFGERSFRRPHHWNQGQTFVPGRPLEPAWLRRAVGSVWRHHGALHSRFEGQGQGWRQVVPEISGTGLDGLPTAVSVVDLSALPGALREAAFETVAAAAQGSLHLEAGPTSRVVLAVEGAAPEPRQRLLLTFHHLLMDGVSWRVVLEDLATALAAVAEGRAPRLPAATTSLVEWGRRLERAASDGCFRHELEHWRRASPSTPPPGPGEKATSHRAVFELDEAATRRLLREAPRAYRTQPNDLLLTALAQALVPAGGSGGDLVVELEGHGREELPGSGAPADLSRTVGWLTSKFPVRLPLGSLADPADPADPAAAIPAVKEALRAVPRRGIGYGVLRYLDPSPDAAELAAAPEPMVVFNYLGRMDPPRGLAWPLEPRFADAGPEVARANQRAGALEVIGLVLDGRLRLIWDHDEEIHSVDRVAELGEACLAHLRRIAEHCAGRRRVRSTPSDFPLAGLDQDGLDRLAAVVPELADAYPMSPVQEGMLFHSLSAPESGVYIEQLVLELAGELDAASLRRAWDGVLARHDVLRTAFVWEGLARPLQAVTAAVELPWHEMDWRTLGDGEKERRLADLLAADRRRGFDVGRAPLMRLYLIREADCRHRLVWCNHHLLVDGWTEAKVLNEVFSLYSARVEGRTASLPPRRPYRDYIAWLEEGDGGAAERFWRSALAGLDGPTLLPPDPAASRDAEGHGEEELLLDAGLSHRLAELARGAGLTTNTLVQGAWALLLGIYTGRRDVVAGITVAGRPAGLPGVDEMVGMFINTLPLRARLRPEAALVDWLRDLQRHTGEVLQHEATPLVDTQGWSGLPRGQALFNTIVVCMNLPRDEASLRRPAAGLRLESAHGIEQTNYPLTVTSRPGERLLLQINHRLDSHTAAHARAVAAHFEALFTALVERPELTVDDVADVVAAADRERAAAAARRQRRQRDKAFSRLARRRPRRPVTVAAEPADHAEPSKELSP